MRKIVTVGDAGVTLPMMSNKILGIPKSLDIGLEKLPALASLTA